MKPLVIGLVTTALLGCSTARPILYSNEKYRQVGSEQATRDIAECTDLADAAGATPGDARGEQVAKNAGLGAVGGAAAGAVGGAIGGSPGIGAAAGAASGVVASLFWSMFGWMSPSQPSDAHVRYVNLCLADRGYQVAGWK